MRKRFHLVLILMIALLVATSPHPARAAGSDRQIFVGYSAKTLSDIDHQDAKTAIKVWSDVLSKDMGDNIVQETEIFPELEPLVDAFKKRQIRMIAVTPVEYLKVRDILQVDPIFTSAMGDDCFAKLLLLVRNDSGIKSLADLRGKNLIIENYLVGEIPGMWLEVALKKAGLPPSKEFFGSVKITAKSTKAITPVFFKQAQACLVREGGFKAMNELNPQIGKQLQELDHSPGFVLGVVGFAKDYDPDLKKTQMTSAVRLHTFPKGQQILTLFKIDKIVLFKDEYLQSTIDLVKEYNALCGKKP